MSERRTNPRPGRERGVRVVPLAAALLLAGSACAPPAPELLILITVDTLRADHLGAYGDPRGLTPRLDALAAESLVFDAAYAPASFTLPSIAAILSGRYPEELGIRNNHAVLGEAVPTLASRLAERGWRTGAVVSNFVLRSGSGLARGFERYDDVLIRIEAGRRIPERAASGTTDALLGALDECRAGGGGCFLWGHYQDPHGPYTPPAGLRERFLPGEFARKDGRRRLPVRQGGAGFGAIPAYQHLEGRLEVGWYRAGYAAEVHQTDAEIGRFLDGVAARGLQERAAIAFASDHGESLGEDEYWFSHGALLSEVLVRVPLFLRVPGHAPARREDLAALVDLFPTLLGLATGAPAPSGHPGRDLLSEGARGAADAVYLSALGGSPIPRYGLVVDRFKLLVSDPPGERVARLHPRGNDAVDLSEGMPNRTRSLGRQLDELRERYAGIPAAPEQALSATEREALGALGYGE